ncbi:Uncharacterised protein [Enterobacter cloacae]|nr:Uncharacterised protein [Enterobacter cloacae]
MFTDCVKNSLTIRMERTLAATNSNKLTQTRINLITYTLIIIKLPINLTCGVFLPVYRAIISETFDTFIIVTRTKNALNIYSRYARKT